MKTDAKNRLRAILTSDLEPGAMVIWTFLRHCVPMGVSVSSMVKNFADTGVEVEESVEILLELELVSKKGVKIKALDVPVERGKQGYVLREGGIALEEIGMDALKAQYDAWRDDHDHFPWPHKEKERAKWLIALEFIQKHKVDVGEYLDVLVKASEGWSKVPIPTPGIMASEFFQQKWLTRSDWLSSHRSAKQKVPAEHAGAEYRPAKALRRKLERGGFSVSSEHARYLDDLATAVKDDPATPVPKKWKAAVAYLVEQR